MSYNTDVVVGFVQSNYTFSEGDGIATVTIQGSAVVAQPFSVRITGGKNTVVERGCG